MMKNIVVLLFLGLILYCQNAFGQKIDDIRANYQKASTDKSVCESLINDLSDGKVSNLQLAYLGALETIWAKYVSNPFSKLSTFNKGKEKIETAVRKEPGNLEIRYLRLSVQKGAPGFLGYDKNIEPDERFLKENLPNAGSYQLAQMIKDLLKSN